MHTMRHIAIPIGNIDIGIGLNMAEQILSGNSDCSDSDLLQLEAELDEEFSKVTTRGTFRVNDPSRKRGVTEYTYGSSGRVYSDHPRPRPSRKTKKISKNGPNDTVIEGSSYSEHESSEPVGMMDSWQDCDRPLEESTTALDSALDELRGMLANVEFTGAPSDSTSAWQERMERREEAWEAHRPAIYKQMVMNSHMPSNAKCQFCSNEATLRCSDCGPWFLLCLACDSSIHASRPCHDREAWMNGYFCSISPRETINAQGAIIQQERCVVLREPELCPLCGATEGFDVNPSTNTRVIVTLKGCYELNDAVLACHSCGSNLQDSECPLDAIDRGFWPGSPQRRTKYLYDLRLFEYYNLLQLNCPGLSESGFLKSLMMYSRKRGRDGIINPATFSKAFHEWRYYSYEIQRLKLSCGTDCPCCHMRQHSVHVDGNKKLYRYAKVPRGPRSQYFKGVFIAPNNEVEQHLELVGYKDESISDYGLCGTTRWKAAKSASKSMANLDETGLEVAGCRHGIAQKAVNLFRGEIFGYPHYLHKTYFQNVLCFWADVICQYWPWAVQKEISTGGTLTSIPCLSVMHANAHSWPCQVLWGGRWQSQAAASTGEDMEQLFSFLSRFNITTKNMTAAGREEQLTCAALFWNTRKIEGLARVLHLRLTKAQKQVADYSSQLLETTHSPDLDVAIELGRLSHCKVQECARNELTDGSLHNLADLAEYFRVKKYVQDAERVQLYLSSTSEALSIITGFHELYVAAKNILDDLPVKKARLTSLERRVAELSLENLDEESLHSAASATLSKLQEQLEMGYLQIQQKHSAIQTKATSSKQRSSLRRAITAEKKKVLKHIQQYNSVVYDVGLELPHLQESDIFDGKFPWSPLSTRHSISMREAYDNAMAYNRLMRAKEEEVLLVQEMCAYISYFKENVLSTLMSQVQSIDDKLTTTRGCGSIVSGNSVEALQTLPVYRYTGPLDESVLLGEKSILMDGVQKAQLMLAEGADLFRPFLNPGYTLENTESEIIDDQSDINDQSDIGDPESDCGSDFD